MNVSATLRLPRLRSAARSLSVACAVLAIAHTAQATTADGTLITNVACATFGTVATAGWPGSGQTLEVSYCATQTVLVATPSIALQKTAAPSIECSGGTITFCIWAVNTSSLTSAFDVVLVDRLPDNVAYLTGQNQWATGTAGGTITYGYGAGGALPTYTWGNTEPANGGVQSGSLYYLRWVVNMIGPLKSAMVCYKVQIL